MASSATSSSLRVIDVAVDAAEFPEHRNPHLKVALILEARPLEVGWQSATGRAVQGRVARCTVSVMPAEMPYATRWPGAGRMVLLSFSDEFLRATDAALGTVTPSLRPTWAQSDPLLTHLGLSVLAAQRAGLASASYLDAAAEVAMVHMLHRYGSLPCARPPAASPAGIARVVDLIESHPGDDLRLSRMAAVAGLSIHGFARAFTRSMGMSPHRYVLRRRIERARHLLRHASTPIAEIAAGLGFSSQSHFTTVFLRETGTTPGRYRTR